MRHMPQDEATLQATFCPKKAFFRRKSRTGGRDDRTIYRHQVSIGLPPLGGIILQKGMKCRGKGFIIRS